MPIYDGAGRREFHRMIEELLTAPTAAIALAAVRDLFVEGLDFVPSSGTVALEHERLPATATRIAQRSGVFVIAVILPDAGAIRADAIRAVLKQLEGALDDIVLVVAEATRDEWQIVTQKITANRQMLRRLVIQADGFRTVVEQLHELANAMDGKKDLRTALDTIYEVEPVRERFFDEYKTRFNSVMTALADVLPSEPTRRLFCQRLFNRLLFVRFLEKRHWLQLPGVNVKKGYLRALWDEYIANQHTDENFYRDRLCRLFFDGLNTQHSSTYVHPQIGSVPYLNGGLFDPAADDLHKNIIVPDAVFPEILGRVGNDEGLLYAFNFTVTEATPLDVEVAVDPEMLGKVFEELVTGRHESGSYYTPKNIVAFMCREALKGYLEVRVPGETPEAITRFVDDHEASDLRDGDSIVAALKTVRICDPACGSGAYLLGMLHELLDLRQCIYDTRRLDGISANTRRKEIIGKNLYGVDIDPFAVGIARLRLWLSLIVEYDGTGDPPPLPNLEFRVETGDSLNSPDPTALLHIDYGKEATTDIKIHGAGGESNPALIQGGFGQQRITEYLQRKAAYLDNHDADKSVERDAIRALEKEIDSLLYGSVDTSAFTWATGFNEVFKGNGGFDIVLTNPPYLEAGTILRKFGREYKQNLITGYRDVGSGTADL